MRRRKSVIRMSENSQRACRSKYKEYLYVNSHGLDYAVPYCLIAFCGCLHLNNG